MPCMNTHELQLRLRAFTLDVIRLVNAHAGTHPAGRVIGEQLVRCLVLAGAQQHMADLKRSAASLARKCYEAMYESIYWLDLLAEAGAAPAHELKPLALEAHELAAVWACRMGTYHAEVDQQLPPGFAPSPSHARDEHVPTPRRRCAQPAARRRSSAEAPAAPTPPRRRAKL